MEKKKMADYSVEIELADDGTLQDMQEANYNLCAFKAVRTSVSGDPLVWFVVNNNDLMERMTIDWTKKYQSYISRDTLEADARIHASTTRDIDLGWVMNVDPKGICTTSPNGFISTGISIVDDENGQKWTTGMSAKVGNQSNMLCGFPLHQAEMIMIEPIEKILLMFATGTIDTGTVKMRAMDQGILIDLTGAPGNSRKVSFSLDHGKWSWSEGSWAQKIPSTSPLNPLLIEVNSGLSNLAYVAKMRK